MIVGMLPFALASKAPAAALAAQGDRRRRRGGRASLALLFAVTVVLGLFIVNTCQRGAADPGRAGGG